MIIDEQERARLEAIRDKEVRWSADRTNEEIQRELHGKMITRFHRDYNEVVIGFHDGTYISFGIAHAIWEGDETRLTNADVAGDLILQVALGFLTQEELDNRRRESDEKIHQRAAAHRRAEYERLKAELEG